MAGPRDSIEAKIGFCGSCFCAFSSSCSRASMAEPAMGHVQAGYVTISLLFCFISPPLRTRRLQVRDVDDDDDEKKKKFNDDSLVRASEAMAGVLCRRVP